MVFRFLARSFIPCFLGLISLLTSGLSCINHWAQEETENPELNSVVAAAPPEAELASKTNTFLPDWPR